MWEGGGWRVEEEWSRLREVILKMEEEMCEAGRIREGMTGGVRKLGE